MRTFKSLCEQEILALAISLEEEDAGLMTALGGLGHTLPYLIPHFNIATTVAVAVVVVELIAIAYIRHHYMDTPLTSAIFQVVGGGVLVFVTGMLIGNS